MVKLLTIHHHKCSSNRWQWFSAPVSLGGDELQQSMDWWICFDWYLLEDLPGNVRGHQVGMASTMIRLSGVPLRYCRLTLFDQESLYLCCRWYVRPNIPEWLQTSQMERGYQENHWEIIPHSEYHWATALAHTPNNLWNTDVVIWFMMSCSLVTINVSEEHTVSIFRVDDGGSMFPQNINNHLLRYMVLQSRRPESELSPLWKPQISTSGILSVLICLQVQGLETSDFSYRLVDSP
jgi:hypothetical protein